MQFAKAVSVRPDPTQAGRVLEDGRPAGGGQFEEDLLFAFEVLIDGGARAPDRLRHRLDGGAVVAVGNEQIARAGEDALARMPAAASYGRVVRGITGPTYGIGACHRHLIMAEPGYRCAEPGSCGRLRLALPG